MLLLAQESEERKVLALMEKHRGSGGAVPPSGPGLHKLVKGMLQVRASASDERVGGSVSDVSISK